MRVMTTASLRRANAETVTLVSMSDGFVPVSERSRQHSSFLSAATGWVSCSPNIPMSYNLSSISPSFRCRYGSAAGSRLILCIKDRRLPQSLLYLGGP